MVRTSLSLAAILLCLAIQSAAAQEADGPALERLPSIDSAETVETPNPLAPAAVIDELADEPVVIEAKAVKKPWSGNLDMGLNGSSGNTELFNFRFNLAANREDDFTKLTLKSNYVRMQSEGDETGNRLFWEGRNEWKFAESPWSWYVHNTTEYDEFRNWRTRVGLDTGLGYNLIKNDLTTLTVRGGPSVSHEFRGPTTDWVPELTAGVQLDHKINDRQKLYFQFDYFPDVRDFNEYRMNTQASWEVVIDEVNNLSLKLSAISRYDTTPEGDSPDDLDYAATLLWSF